MDGTTRTGSDFLPELTDQNWKMVGAADFNSDGKPDLLWRNTANGQNAVWYMDGTTRTGSGFLPQLADQNWMMVVRPTSTATASLTYSGEIPQTGRTLSGIWTGQLAPALASYPNSPTKTG